MAVTINEGTQTNILTTDVGGTETQVIRLDVGSGTNASAFTGSIANIGVVHNAGTISALPDPLGSVTMTVGTLTQGSLTNIGVIHNAGTIAALPDPLGSVVMTVGTVSSIPQISVGTLPTLNIASLPDLAGGTIDVVTSVAGLPDPLGSVVMTVGTVSSIPNITVDTFTADIPGGTVDAITNLASGTLAVVTDVTDVTNITGGTITRVENGTIAVSSLPDPVGSVVMTVGTVSSLPNVTVDTFTADIPGGTIDQLTTGTIVTDNVTYRFADEFATTVSTGTSTLGTIKPAVSGSVIYVTDIKISVQAPTNVEIASGGTSTPIIGTNFFAGSGGMVANYRVPIPTASGSALVYKQSANTGMTIDVQGYVD